MSAQSPELLMKIAVWRQKARDKTLTQEEMREAIAALRKDREGTAQATSGTKARATAKAKAAKPDGDDLLSQLESF